MLARKKRFLSLAHRLTAIAALACLVVVATACEKKSYTPEGASEISRAGYLIDKGQYSEAIFTLEARLQSHPGDDRARVQLASAYCARSGIYLTKYTGFAAQLTKDDDVNLPVIGTGFKSKLVSNILQAVVAIEKVARIVDALPDLDTDMKLSDMRMALKVLSASDTLKGGAALYRALIRASLFKHGIVAENKLGALGNCDTTFDDLVPTLRSVTAEVSPILKDISVALKDDKQRAVVADIDLRLTSSVDDLDKKIAKGKESGDHLPDMALSFIKSRGFKCE